MHALADTVQLGSIKLAGFLMLTLICFFCLLASLTIAFFSTVEIFLSLPLSLLVCLCIAISLPKYYLLGSRQTDFG